MVGISSGADKRRFDIPAVRWRPMAAVVLLPRRQFWASPRHAGMRHLARQSIGQAAVSKAARPISLSGAQKSASPRLKVWLGPIICA